MSEVSRVIDAYCAAWSHAEESGRGNLLASVWAVGAADVDPGVHAPGEGDLLAHIKMIHAKRPAFKVVRSSEIDHHNNYGRFSWKALMQTKGVLVETEGQDFVVFTSDGLRIEKIIGFMGGIKRS